jgi:hypothetical protein
VELTLAVQPFLKFRRERQPLDRVLVHQPKRVEDLQQHGVDAIAPGPRAASRGRASNQANAARAALAFLHIELWVSRAGIVTHARPMG